MKAVIQQKVLLLIPLGKLKVLRGTQDQTWVLNVSSSNLGDDFRLNGLSSRRILFLEIFFFFFFLIEIAACSFLSLNIAIEEQLQLSILYWTLIFANCYSTYESSICFGF